MFIGNCRQKPLYNGREPSCREKNQKATLPPEISELEVSANLENVLGKYQGMVILALVSLFAHS